MFRRLLRAFLVLGVLCAPAWADKAAPGLPIQLGMSADLGVGLVIPPGWIAQGKLEMPGEAADLELVSMNGKHKLKITLLVPKGVDLPEGSLGKMVRAHMSKDVAGSVEGKITVSEVRTDTTFAVHATLTDKALAGKPVPPGSWRHVTVGVSKLKGLMTNATLYSQEAADPGHALALAAWVGLRTISAPLTEMSFADPGGGGPVVIAAPGLHQLEAVLGPPPEGMVFKHGPPPPSKMGGQRADGFAMTVETVQVDHKAPTSRWCQSFYAAQVVASWKGHPKVSLDEDSIKVEDRGEWVRYAYELVGKISAKENRKMKNVVYLLGRPGHCTVVHMSLSGATEATQTLLDRVEQSIKVGK
jgi:hypothetical protein